MTRPRSEFPLFEADPTQPGALAYLYHLDPPYGHSRHYLGSTPDFPRRDKQHGTRRGAKLLHLQKKAGGTRRLVRTWKGGARKESELKSQSGARYCPECNEHPLPGINTVPRRRKTRKQRQAEQDEREVQAEGEGMKNPNQYPDPRVNYSWEGINRRGEERQGETIMRDANVPGMTYGFYDAGYRRVDIVREGATTERVAGIDPALGFSGPKPGFDGPRIMQLARQDKEIGQ